MDAPFPPVKIPLAGEESLTFDFGAVYQHTYRVGRWGTMVDYRQLPERFETYSPADKARIQQVITRVTKMAADGIDLDDENVTT